jgi:hypothetical protein
MCTHRDAADTLYGADGADELYGWPGNDTGFRGHEPILKFWGGWGQAHILRKMGKRRHFPHGRRQRNAVRPDHRRPRRRRHRNLRPRRRQTLGNRVRRLPGRWRPSDSDPLLGASALGLCAPLSIRRISDILFDSIVTDQPGPPVVATAEPPNPSGFPWKSCSHVFTQVSSDRGRGCNPWAVFSLALEDSAARQLTRSADVRSAARSLANRRNQSPPGPEKSTSRAASSCTVSPFFRRNMAFRPPPF